MAKITINGVTIDPQAQAAAPAFASLMSADSSASNYIIVQAKAPLLSDQKGELAALGVEILSYAPENAYICRYAPADLKVIRDLPFVEWANVYLRGFKVAPQLHSPSAARTTADLLSLGQPETSMAQELKRVEVVLHHGVSADAVREKVAAAARLDPETLQVAPGKIRLSVMRQYLEGLTQIDEVRQIEEYHPPQLTNNVALQLLRADVVHANLEFEGQGQVVAICDTGFDRGSTADVHPAFGARVRRLYALGRPSSASDPNGHGTHVAGSVAGDGQTPAMGGRIRGAAPRAELVVQSVLDASGSLGGLPVNLNDLFTPPYRDDNARVHTNSWVDRGSGANYTIAAHEVDEFVWNHRDCVVCFAAGNEGVDLNANGAIDNGTVRAPGTARNCITIGAAESQRPIGAKKYGEVWSAFYPAEPMHSDDWANNPEGIAAFSGRGPTSDGRIKPDLVAPGTAILSTHSRAANVGSFWGASSDPLYCFMGGTSMATPLVAGCAAVVREFFQSQHQHSPSAALVKAMLINGARDLAGQYIPSEAGAIPNNAEGFGCIDLANTVGPFPTNLRLTFKDETTQLDTNEEEVTTVNINSPQTTLKVTLVWTDLPGEHLQNDLDLIVLASNGQERHGNLPASSLEFDRNNNVEQVVWENPPIGQIRITVRAFRSVHASQAYALIVRLA
ncbi:MAG: S8 family serine peptidase [Acidobacteriota bacterium]|nr:S8 family serine peptidase [Acidobacteriota bacterium]